MNNMLVSPIYKNYRNSPVFIKHYIESIEYWPQNLRTRKKE